MKPSKQPQIIAALRRKPQPRDAAVARAFGVSREYVRQIRVAIGLNRVPPDRDTIESRVLAFVSKHPSGVSVSEIRAAMPNVAASTVRHSVPNMAQRGRLQRVAFGVCVKARKGGM